MTTKTWSRNMGQLAIDPDETGLVAGYNMVPRADGTIEDLSGNGNHGTIDGPGFEYTEIGPSMRFDGVDDEIEIADDPSLDITDDLTLIIWVKTTDPTSTIYMKWLSTGNNRSFRLDTNLGVVAFIKSTTGSNFEEISSVKTIDDGLTHMVSAVYTASTDTLCLYIDGELDTEQAFTVLGNIYNSTADLRIGNGSRGPYSGSLMQPKYITRALTAAEIQAEYQAGAKAINWKSDYGVSESAAAESAPGELSNSPARVISGTHQISSDTIDGKTAKIIECVTAGVVAIPTAYFHGDDTQAAHGSFEWWVNKALDANVLTVGITGNQATAPATAGYNGYAISIAADESLSLLKFTNGVPSTLLSTAAGFVSIATWNKLKLTISATGEFTLYMNNALVDVTGGSGTNPVTDTTYTTSKNVVLDSDAGDKVGWSAKNGSCAIVKKQGVV